MGSKKIAQLVTDYYRNSLDNAMSVSREYREGMSNLFTGKSPWISGEGKTFIGEWTKSYKKGYDDFRETGGKYYNIFETLFNLPKRPETTDTENARKLN